MTQQLLFEEPAIETVSPRLTDYDWIVVNTSAGKDSQCMLDVICEEARREGILDRVVAVHCDLAEEEWKGTKELAEEQAKHYGIRFETVKRKQGGILEHVIQRLKSLVSRGKTNVAPWPSMTERWCTSDHKRGQVSTLFTKLVNELVRRGKGTPPWPSHTNRWCTSHHKTNQVSQLFTRLVGEKRHRPVQILNCMGMRANESCQRAKLTPFKLDKANTNGKRTVHIWLPIFHWTLEEVWVRCRQAGTPIHYAYGMGMPRVSCCFCIYAPKNALMLAGKHNPELLDRYCEVEEKTGFTFKKGLALVDIREALRRGEEPGPVESWEM